LWQQIEAHSAELKGERMMDFFAGVTDHESAAR